MRAGGGGVRVVRSLSFKDVLSIRRSRFERDKGCLSTIVMLILGIGMILAMDYVDDQLALKPITEKTGVKSWAEHDLYMESNFAEGMPYKNVHGLLARFGKYKLSSAPDNVRTGTYCEIIEIPTGKTIFLNRPKLGYLFCFLADNDSLHSWTLYPG